MVTVAVRSKAVILILFIRCLLLLPWFVDVLKMLGPCFGLQYFVSFLVFVIVTLGEENVQN